MDLLKAALDLVMRFIYRTALSLRYSTSRKTSVLVGGFLVTFSYMLIGLPFLLGYINRSIKYLLNGITILPPMNHLVQMYADGIRIAFIAVEYALISSIIYILAVTIAVSVHDIASPAIGGLEESARALILNTDGRGVVVISKGFVLASAFIEGLLYGMLFGNSWLRYAAYGSFISAINPISTLKWIAMNPRLMWNNMYSIGVASFLIAAPGILAYISLTGGRLSSIAAIIVGLLMPWVIFIGFMSNAYIRINNFHQMMRKGQIRHV
ncbi:hypothetical protein CUJ83_04960 [Methanocella sp. CWC-04]|uniref:Uncharacterized protein n=1 Tax=Methanooceanicella nereidis TaxID=2052831 RepID=A0AAP2RBF2_9EURY|nr:DUF4013 domain-containing protein [Methanocella sp. CWC-04]MCD1294348.1 hypothetical protein [Methanocella sp. CWC-04]